LTKRSKCFAAPAEVDPNNGDSQRNLANALFDHDLVDDAAVHAARAVALQPNDPGAHDVLGRTLAATGKLVEAREQFERALQVAPGDPDARADLAKLQRFMTGR